MRKLYYLDWGWMMIPTPTQPHFYLWPLFFASTIRRCSPRRSSVGSFDFYLTMAKRRRAPKRRSEGEGEIKRHSMFFLWWGKEVERGMCLIVDGHCVCVTPSSHMWEVNLLCIVQILLRTKTELFIARKSLATRPHFSGFGNNMFCPIWADKNLRAIVKKP